MASVHPPDKLEKLARIFDAEIWPIYGQRFAALLLKTIERRPGLRVLDVGCGTGALTVELANALGGGTQIIAVESTPALLAGARARIAASPRAGDISVESAAVLPRLPFDDQQFDLVVSNLGLADVSDRGAAIAELARVLKPGGQIALTLPLEGSWAEFLDIYREVLLEHGKTDALHTLDAYVARLPSGDEAARLAEDAGLQGARVELDRWELLFKSAREFFFAPVIELGPLSRWKTIAGRGDEMQDVFFFIKEAIEAYYTGRVFAVSLVAGCVHARKPLG